MDKVFRKLEQGKSKAFFSAGGRRLIVNYGDRFALYFSWKGMKGARLLRNRGHSVQSLRGIIAGSWRIVGHEEPTVPWNSPISIDFSWGRRDVARLFLLLRCETCASVEHLPLWFKAGGGARRKVLKGNDFPWSEIHHAPFFFLLLIKLVKSWCLGWAWIWRIKDLN